MTASLGRFSFREKPLAVQWAAIVALSLLLAAGLTALRLPAALLLSAIGAAATIASLEGRPKMPPRAVLLAQAVLGGMIAQYIKPAILLEIWRDWPLFVAAALSVIGASCLIGWALTRWRLFPDSTAIWGSLPGAASAMVLMAEAYGADMRLVAFMQYLRVLLVALVASLVARFFAPGGGAAPASFLTQAQSLIDWTAFGLTCVLLLVSAWAGRRFRIPAGPLLLPLVVAATAQDLGLLTIELPRAVLAISYAILGWSIGLRFSRDILLHAFRTLPAILGATFLLLALCGGFGVLLSHFAHVDARPPISPPAPADSTRWRSSQLRPSSTCPLSWPCRRRGSCWSS